MEKLKVILDTDIGGDCDDAGAIAVLHNLERAGKAEILAITHCGGGIAGACDIKAINEWYSRGDIPVGRYRMTENQAEEIRIENERYAESKTGYAVPVMQEYLAKYGEPEFIDGGKLIRKVLSENDDVTIISIGTFCNLAKFLKMGADEISPLTSKELVEKSVREMYSMGGNFADLNYAESNIMVDVSSAQYISENFAKPITYCGFEIGNLVKTGKLLKDEPEDNPVRGCYMHHFCQGIRESWDPITVYAAIEKENSFMETSQPVTVTFDNEGKVLLKDGGKDKYLILKSTPEALRDEIDNLMI